MLALAASGHLLPVAVRAVSHARRRDDAPARLRKGAGRYPQPVALLAWLGMDTRHTGQGPGPALLPRRSPVPPGRIRRIGYRRLLVRVESGTARGSSVDLWISSFSCTLGVSTVNELRRIHFLAMTPGWDIAPHEHATDEERPGYLRQHDIRPFPRGMTPPPWPDVPARTGDWIDSVKARREYLRTCQPTSDPLPELLAELHNQFERVHPFLDGNGRTGRLALNLILVRLGYPPVIIYKRQRDAYLTAMRKADDEDFGPLGELVARAMLDNLNRFIVPNVAGPARMIPLAALANKEFTVAALRQAAQRGRLDAIQASDGVWLSSRRAIRDYKRIKHRRRPKAT